MYKCLRCGMTGGPFDNDWRILRFDSMEPGGQWPLCTLTRSEGGFYAEYTARGSTGQHYIIGLCPSCILNVEPEV